MASREAARAAAIAGLGGFIVIFALAELSKLSGAALLIAPFGASCVLVFALPASPLAQPRNVIGGHLVSTAVGLVAFMVFGTTPLGFATGVGLAIAAMLLTRTTHPPAGASWSFLLAPDGAISKPPLVSAGAARLTRPDVILRLRAADRASTP